MDNDLFGRIYWDSHFFGGLFFLVFAFMTACSGVSGTPHLDSRENSKELDMLIYRAREQGRVRVIIKLNVQEFAEMSRTASAEQDPDAIEAADRQIAERIAAAADSVLAQIGNSPHRVYRRYRLQPLIALEVSEEALRILASSPDVLEIREDIARPLK